LECLTAFYKCILPDNIQTEVFLVDDGSSDGTSLSVKEHFPKVKLISGDGTLYWNRGMYLAWETASRTQIFDYYLWLNDDVKLYSNAITEIMSSSEEFEDQAIICSFLTSENDNTKTTYGGIKNNVKLSPNGKLQEVELMNGNVVLIPRFVFEKVGNLDPIFPHAIGDYDYGLRAKKKGINIVSTRKYVGVCENNPQLPKWCLSEFPFSERLKVLYSPLGNAHPKYFFIYEFRHFGLFTALKHYISIHLRALNPKLWK